MDERQIEARARERLDEFMAQLVRVQRPLFQQILMFLPHASDAEDVMQETVLAAWKDFEKFTPGSNFFGWVRRIAYHRILKLRRDKARGLAVLDDEVLELLASESAQEPVPSMASRDALANCLEKLPAHDRQLIESRYQAGMTGEALAAQLGRPRNSIYKSLGRIRRALLECLQRQLNSPSL